LNRLIYNNIFVSFVSSNNIVFSFTESETFDNGASKENATCSGSFTTERLTTSISLFSNFGVETIVSTGLSGETISRLHLNF